MDRMDVELIGLGIAFVSSMVFLLMLVLRDKVLDRKESGLDDKLKSWADKYAELKGEYLQVDAERVEWQRMYEEKANEMLERCQSKDEDYNDVVNDRRRQQAELIQAQEQININREHHQKLIAEITHWSSTAMRTQGYLDMCKHDYEKLRTEMNEVLRERDELKQKIEERQKQDHETAKLVYEHAPSFREQRKKQAKERRELEEKVVALEKQLAEANDACDGAVVDAQVYEKRVAECQSEIEAKEQLLKISEENVALLQQASHERVRDVEQEIQQLNADKESMAKEIEILNRVAVRREEWIAELERANDILNPDTRDERIEKLEQQVKYLSQSLKESEEAREILIEIGKENTEERTRTVKQLREKLRSLEFDLNNIRTSRRDLHDEVIRLQGELSACNNQNRELSIEVSRQKDSATIWRQRCAERDEQAARQVEEMIRSDVPKDTMPEIHRLEVELSRKDAENNSLRNQLEDLGEKYDAMVAAKDRLRAWCDKKDRDVSCLRAEIDDLRQQNSKLKQENTRLIVDYGKADPVACETPFRLDIDTQAFKDSLDLTVKRCEELKRAIVEANGGKRAAEEHPREWRPEETEDVVDGVSPGLNWEQIGGGASGSSIVRVTGVNGKPLLPRSLDLEEIDSTVDGDGGSKGDGTLSYMRGE